MAKKFRPVDHKDTDAAYAARVQDSVAKRVGAELLSIPNASTFHGRWKSSFRRSRDAEYDVEHLPTGEMLLPLSAHSRPGEWKFESGIYSQTTWVPPMPEYGMHEASWNEEAYHCAQTADGRIVYWNGDGSLVVTLTKAT